MTNSIVSNRQKLVKFQMETDSFDSKMNADTASLNTMPHRQSRILPNIRTDLTQISSISPSLTSQSALAPSRHESNLMSDSHCHQTHHHHHRNYLWNSWSASTVSPHQSPLSLASSTTANSLKATSRSVPIIARCSTMAQSIIHSIIPAHISPSWFNRLHQHKLSSHPHHKRSHSYKQHMFIHRHYNSIISVVCLLVAAVLCSISPDVNAVPFGSISKDSITHNNNQENLGLHINNKYYYEHSRNRNGNNNLDRNEHWSMAEANEEPKEEEEESPNASSNDDAVYKNQTCLTDHCIQATGLLSSSMDTQVQPCDNFYKYVCGKWIEDHPIPQYLHEWSHFQHIAFTLQNNLKGLLNNFTLFETKPEVFRNLFNFYHGCLNKEQRDKIGYVQLKKIADDLGGWPMLNGAEWDQKMNDSFYWENAYLKLTKQNLYFLIRIEVMTDFRNTSQIIIKIGPPYKTTENIINLGRHQGPQNFELAGHRSTKKEHILVASRPWMKITSHEQIKQFNESSMDEDVRDIFKEIVNELKGSESLDKEMLDKEIDQIFKLQNELENMAAPIPPMEYYQKNYEKHLMTTAEIRELVDFDLIYIVEQMFNQTFNDTNKFFVPDKEYLKQLGPLIKAKPKRIMANYFAGNMVYSTARHTTTKMIELLVTKLNAPEVLPNVCFEETSIYLPELLGKLYVDVYFKQDSSDNLNNSFVKLLRESFHQLITESKWMDDQTINEAVAKLNSTSMNIAYPEWYTNETKFEDYCNIYKNIDRANYFGSVIDVNKATHLIAMLELSDRFNSDTNRPTSASWPSKQIIDVNAFYYFSTNGIYIPAGIVQYPFYLDGLPFAMSFGSIGMIIGHEMTHAFDNSGRLYDKNGALRNWWTNSTLGNFSKKTDCFVKQYDSYQLNSIKINGKQTLAENIADNSGLREAYRAMQIYQNQNPDIVGQRLPGQMSKFDADQLFFISFANMWCTNLDKSAIQNQAKNNVHSPAEIRVLGTLSNFDKFSQAFQCAPGTRMNPKDKCVLW